MKKLKYEKEYSIRTYECDANSNLRLITLFNIFQDIADEHAENLGVGLSFCLEKGFAWVGSNYHIKIDRMPRIHEKIKIKSWPSQENKFGAVRDFAVYDENEKLIIVGSSIWILINYARRRPILLRDNLPEYTVIPERSLDTNFEKLQEVLDTDSNVSFKIRLDDIDINNHVNNAVYPLWATESVDYDFQKNNRISEIEIEFKKEALLGEEVVVQTNINDKTSLHSIKSLTDNRELSRIRITWQEQSKEYT